MATVFRAFLLALALLGFASARSTAATYDVWACTLPNGQPAAAGGWAPDAAGERSAAQNWCSYSGDKMFAALRGEIWASAPAGSFAGWTFTAPPESLISSYTLWRWARTSQSGSTYLDYYLDEDIARTTTAPYLVEWCGRYLQCSGRGSGSGDRFQAANRVDRSGILVHRIYASLVCDAVSGQSCLGSFDGARVFIYSARVSLTDYDAPRFTRPPSGSLLASNTALEGERSISIDASDRGGGIERIGVVADGRSALSTTPDPHVATCRRPFTTPRPCRAATSNTLVFDTAQLPNGTHTIQASVTDAAGNETRSDPVTVTTLNGSQPNGRSASRFVKLTAYLRSKRDTARRSAVVPFGSVRFAEGRLVDAAGKPIAGAVLGVDARVQRPGARYGSSGTVTTGEDGRFAFRIAKGASRTIRFAYKAYTLDPAPVSTASISLGVRAGLKLSLRPHHVNNGQKVKFSGRLRGGPNRKGTRVTIDVLVPDARRRVPIGNVKADRRGRFHFAYRFRRTLVKARYRFQARLTPQPSYPYRGATSRRVAVVVSP